MKNYPYFLVFWVAIMNLVGNTYLSARIATITKINFLSTSIRGFTNVGFVTKGAQIYIEYFDALGLLMISSDGNQ